jgi:hypothetical protein
MHLVGISPGLSPHILQEHSRWCQPTRSRSEVGSEREEQWGNTNLIIPPKKTAS